MIIIPDFLVKTFSKKELLYINIYFSVYKFISFLAISSVFIATTGFLLPYFSFLLYGIKVNFNLLLASFLCIYAIYSLNKLSDLKEDAINMPERVGFIVKYKNYVLVSIIISVLASLFLSFVENPYAIFIMLFPFLMGILYSIKIFNFRLKDVIGIKNITVALSWAVIGTFLPITVPFKINLILTSLIFYFFFLRVFIGSIASDVRDIDGDKKSGIKTIPVAFGLHKTRILLLFLNSTLLPWLAISYILGFFHSFLLVLVFFIFYGYIYILLFCRKELKIGKSMDLIIDGEWIPTVILSLFLLR